MVVGVAALLAAYSSRGQSDARQAGYLYLSPIPGASYVSAQNRYILVRFTQITPSQVTNLASGFITVNGDASGPHSGTTRVASDGRTVMFVIGANFSENESVTVTLNPEVDSQGAGRIESFQYQFMVTAPFPGSVPLVASLASAPIEPKFPKVDDTPAVPVKAPVPKRGIVPKATVLGNGVSVPSDFPQVALSVNVNPSPGYLFLENGLNLSSPYTMIMDNNGFPVWYRRGRMYDFKIQKNGYITWCLSDDTGFPAFDQNFNYIQTYLTTNGYSTDGHELKIEPDGSYYMIGYRTNMVDLSQYVLGGFPDSAVRETVLQKFTAAGDLILQWRAWDNYDIADENGDTDFPHMNGIDIDEDGNILVSARHLSEITKIDQDSGQVIWRLSGAHSSFTFPDDPFNGTSFQHNISALGNGHYMVFDNGNYHFPQISRAVEYQLDLTNMTASVAWQFRDTPDKYTDYLGSAQRLPGGNTLINFVLAGYPKAIEVDTNGVKHFEMNMIPGADAYRAFRLPWNGVVAGPYLLIEPGADNITLVFNKFGDTNVAYYRIYGGQTPEPTTLLSESSSTLQQLNHLQNGTYYFRVTAVNQQGTESPFSNEESVRVNIVPPGANLVANGDFSQGTMDWALSVSPEALASLDTNNGAGQIVIGQAGPTSSDIEFFQGGIPLIEGKQYVLQFDAWSSQPCYMEVSLARAAPPNLSYSALEFPFLTPYPTHYRYLFTMQEPSDFSAELLFQLGGSAGEITLANIYLFTPAAGDLNLDTRVDFLDLGILTSNWLKQQPGLMGDLNGDGKVDFNDFGIMGENWTSGEPNL